jgi:predicted Zn finger-like uncharacterized protein
MVVECPQCGTAELLDEESFGDRSRLEVECANCQHTFVVHIPAATHSADKSAKPREIQHTGLTTVVELHTRLPEGKKVALVAMKGPAKGMVFPITKPEVILGRLGADLVIADNQISSKHCVLEVRDTTAILRDLGSTNGIIIGATPVKTAQLEHLSEFRIGASTLMFTVTDMEDPYR